MRVDGDPLHTGKGLEGPSVHQQVIRFCELLFGVKSALSEGFSHTHVLSVIRRYL